jgi:hypothetical protein
MHSDRSGLAAKIPQQALFGDSLCDPPEEPILYSAEPASRFGYGIAAMPILCSAEHDAELLPETSEQASGRLGTLGRPFGLTRRFAVELVTVASNRNDEHVHRH